MQETVISPINDSVEPSPSSVERSAQAYEARIIKLELELNVLREREARACLVLDSATDYAIITLDAKGCVTSWNKGAQTILGYSEIEILGRSGEVVFTAEDRDNGRFGIELRLAAETGRANNERWHLRRNGTRFWASGLMMPLIDENGQPNGYLNILRDRTEIQAAIERRELLMDEMKHRMNNTFAMVQAVATQTRKYTETSAEFGAMFSARLGVLARSNEVLTRADFQEASLQELIENALVVHDDGPGRIVIEGPSVQLGANLTLAVSLSFHELATNAVKHGALSNSAGRVTVSWVISRTSRGISKVEITWRESGGPMVEPPVRRGFGSKLLENGIPPGGTIKLDFQPGGLECCMCLPLSNIAE